jgi:hypothetical protein
MSFTISGEFDFKYVSVLLFIIQDLSKVAQSMVSIVHAISSIQDINKNVLSEISLAD